MSDSSTESVDPVARVTVLDEAALGRLRDLDPKGEHHLLERVLKAFDGSVARLLPQLLQARSEGDQASIRHVAHTLKSSSASIGAIKLSRICADIETQVRLNTFDELGLDIDDMCGEIESVLVALKRVMKSTP
jgi:HPt (histidine-containing phosphotransfer) domain-containing protein